MGVNRDNTRRVGVKSPARPLGERNIPITSKDGAWADQENVGLKREHGSALGEGKLTGIAVQGTSPQKKKRSNYLRRGVGSNRIAPWDGWIWSVARGTVE